MSTKDSISKFYNEKKDFIIIGLTERTGSGCSKVAEILRTEKFSDFKLKDPKTYDYNNSEEMKCSIVLEYVKASGNWKPFKTIEMSSIITWLIIEEGYDRFIEYLEELNSGIAEFNLTKLIDELNKNDFRDKFDSINDLRP